MLTIILTSKAFLGNFLIFFLSRLRRILENFILGPGEIRHSPPPPKKSSLPWLLDSFDLPRYGSESKKRYLPRLVSRADYGFDQWSVVSFVIKKLFVYLFMVKQCIYLVVQMYITKFTNFVVFPNFLLNLNVTWTIKESKILRRFKESR